MSNEKIRTLINQLHDELTSTELDSSTQQLLKEFSAATEAQFETELRTDDESLVDTAKELETLFAVEHPVAERVMREIIEALAKMGI